MGDLRPIKGARAKKSEREKKEEGTRRIVFVPVEGALVCFDANTHYALALQAPVLVTVPESAVGYIAPEAS